MEYSVIKKASIALSPNSFSPTGIMPQISNIASISSRDLSMARQILTEKLLRMNSVTVLSFFSRYQFGISSLGPQISLNCPVDLRECVRFVRIYSRVIKKEKSSCVMILPSVSRYQFAISWLGPRIYLNCPVKVRNMPSGHLLTLHLLWSFDTQQPKSVFQCLCDCLRECYFIWSELVSTVCNFLLGVK